MKAIKQIEAISQDEYTGNELFFDPEDGQLKVIKKGDNKPSPDSQVISQIAEDGFM